MGTTIEAGAGTKVVKSSRDPVFVQAQLPSPLAWLQSAAERRDLKSELVRDMRRAAQLHPQRVVTLRLPEQQFQFERLSGEVRTRIAAISGDEAPKNFYERRLAGLIKEVLDQVRENRPPLMLSVSGLPVESNSGGEDIADITNRNYRQVIESMEVVITPRTLLIRGGDAGAMARNTLPKSFAHANGRAVFFKSNNGWRLAVATEGPRASTAGGGEQTLQANEPLDLDTSEVAATQSPMDLLIADWGLAESMWDLNGDGTVNVTDLLMLISDWEQYNQGATASSSQEPIARWVNAPAQYTIGSGQHIALELLEGAPAGVHVVFQTWSDVSESIEGVHQDSDAPFAYPASALDQVTPGGAEIQALVRKSNNQIVATIRANVAFTSPEPPPPPPPPPTTSGTGGTTGTGGTGGTTGTGNTGGSGQTPVANPGADPNAPAPTPVITLLSNTGQAPFTVHAHGLATTLGVGDASTARYEWNFGDADGDYNTLAGFNAAHVYDNPGEYTITLKVINQAGKPAAATATVVVQPSARTVYYVADTGNDANPGTSVNTPIKSAERVAELMGDNVEFRFRRAGTYDVASTIPVNSSNVVISSYGNGATPVLRWMGASQYQNIFEVGSAASGVTIEDIAISSNLVTVNPTVVRGIQVRGSNITVRRCDFTKVSYAMNGEAGGANGWLSMNNTSGVLGSNYAWCEGQNVCHIGNTIAGSVDEHAIRVGGAQRVLIAHNDITNESKSTIWCMLGDYASVNNNKLRKGRFSAGPNSAAGANSERTKYVVFESNEMFEQGVILYAGLENSVLRNNVVRFNGGEAFSIWGYYAAKDRTCKNIAVLNNTVINNAAMYGRCVRIGADAENIVVANNVYMAPNLNAQSGAANAYINGSDLDGLMFRRNMWATPKTGSSPHMIGGTGQSVSDWAANTQVVSDSYRAFTGTEMADGSLQPLFDVLTGEAVAGVLVDFNGKLRPVTGAVSVGVIETATGVTPTIPTTPPTTPPPTTPPPTTPPPTTPPPTTPPPTTPPPTTPPPSPTNQPQTSVPPVTLSSGATTIANKLISGTTGVVGDNATSVSTLTMTNVTINSTNYGVYLGSCQNAVMDQVNITCAPNGPDSYSVRGYINSFVSKDSTYKSGIKAFRIYGLTSGSSTRDTIMGDRLMLGGGAADEWVSPQPFANFTFTDARIDVNSIELYNATHHVTFTRANFAGTGHISIMPNAHHLTFNNCTNMPEVKYFGPNGGRIYPTAAELAARNIVFNN